MVIYKFILTTYSMIKHTTVKEHFALLTPYHMQREGQIPLTNVQKAGVRNREPRAIYDDYQAPLESRKAQYPEYFKNIPFSDEDPSHDRIIWWRPAIPHINAVEIMEDGIAINQINDTVLGQNDTYGKYDMKDLMDVESPFNQTIINNDIAKHDLFRADAHLASKIGGTRSIVADDIIANLNAKLAAINRLPGNKAQLLNAQAVKEHYKLLTSEKSMMKPHLSRRLYGSGGKFNKGPPPQASY